jgi:hypothetical protein
MVLPHTQAGMSAWRYNSTVESRGTNW